MSLTHASALRSAIADLVDDTVNTGSGTAKLRFRAGTTTIVDFPLQNPAFGSASSGDITLAGTPIIAAAVSSGDLDNFQLLDRDGNVQVSGTITAIGMGGDITIDEITIASSQAVRINALTYSAPV